MYRALAHGCVGRTIASVSMSEGYADGVDETALEAALVGGEVTDSGRHGKVAWLELASGHRLGMRFGMTGRLLVDDSGPIDSLLYGPNAAPGPDRWERFAVAFDSGETLSISDPRRFGSVELDPDLTRLGPDALAVTAAQMRPVLTGARSLKSVLLDQNRLAGLGNLLVDEVLWRGDFSPHRTSAEVASTGAAPLARLVRTTIAQLYRRGGSHRGDHVSERHRDGHCPRDGAPWRRDTVAGRTTYWCPVHQL